MELIKSMFISASGMRVQGERSRVIAENVANANSLPQTPNQEPYRRKILTFKSTLDRELGAEIVAVNKRTFDKSEFGTRYDGANADGYVSLPNVNGLIEAIDMKEAQRTYEANLNMIESVRAMVSRTIELIR
ncbi:MAG: flagellar basal body rod protein FlgC [Proteobacteria bacterium]|nr:flagellar basal body rod protein FlgC [Pseudomonadota bacterium]